MRNLLVIIFLLASLSGLAQSADGIFQTVTASGQNSYTIAAALPNASAYDSKEKFIVVFTLASTGSVTLNRNGIGAKAVRDSEGTQLGSGDILAGQRLLLSYNGTYYQVIGGTGSGSVSQTITNGVTDSSPSEDAIFDRFGNVDNTSDASKPVSTAQQTAIDLKQNLDADLTAVAANGTSLQQIRVPSGGGTLEYFTPTADPSTTVGDMPQLVSISPNVYGRLVAVATGNAIISGGVGTISSWGKIGLTTHVSGTLPVSNGGTGSTSGLPLNNLIGATGTNTINHAASLQRWQWNTLAGTTGMQFEAATTAAASNAQTLVNIALSGANATASQETFALAVSNTHTGTSGTNRGGDFTASGGNSNIAIRATASGGTNNYAGIFSGRVGIGTTAPGVDLQINASQPALIWSQSDATKGVVGVAGASNGLITGSVTGDFAIRNSQKIMVSVDAGTSSILNLGGTSSVQVAGSFATPYVAKTALYTLTGTDHTVEVTSGTHTQTLPTAVGIAGRKYIVTNSGSGTVTIGTTSSQTFVNVSGTPTTLTLAQFQSYMVQSNNANWLAFKMY